MFFLLFLYFVGASGKEFTLPGVCKNLSLQMKLDYAKFSGLWYHVGGYSSDGEDFHDCATLYFKKDSLWYTLKETYVDGDKGNRTQLSYSVMLHTHHHPNVSAQFFTSFKYEDNLLEYPLSILSTDYDSYAILYVCKWLKEAVRKHHIFTWILTRSIEKPHGDTLKKIEDALAKYTELAEHREEFVFKEFNDATCAFSKKSETDFFSSNIF